MLHWVSISLRRKSRLAAMPMWQEQLWGSSVTSLLVIIFPPVPVPHSCFLTVLGTSQDLLLFGFVFFFNLQEFVCALPNTILHGPGSLVDFGLSLIYSAMNQTLGFTNHDRLSCYLQSCVPMVCFPHLAFCIWAGTTSVVFYIVFPTTMPSGTHRVVFKSAEC